MLVCFQERASRKEEIDDVRSERDNQKNTGLDWYLPSFSAASPSASGVSSSPWSALFLRQKSFAHVALSLSNLKWLPITCVTEPKLNSLTLETSKSSSAILSSPVSRSSARMLFPEHHRILQNLEILNMQRTLFGMCLPSLCLEHFYLHFISSIIQK